MSTETTKESLTYIPEVVDEIVESTEQENPIDNTQVAFRITLEPESDTSREEYSNRFERLTDSLEADIATMGPFETAHLSRVADPYTRLGNKQRHIEVEIAKNKDRLYEREMKGYEIPLLDELLGRSSNSELREKINELEEKYIRLSSRQSNQTNVFTLAVDFAPLSPAPIEALLSEFNRLASYEGVADTAIERAVPTVDFREQVNEF